MNRKTFFKKTVKQIQQIYDDKWDEGVDLKVQYGTKGLPKNHKNYKALTLDSEVMMGEGGKKIFKHDDPKAEASALKKINLDLIMDDQEISQKYKHIAIEYVSHDNDRDQQYRVYLWK